MRVGFVYHFSDRDWLGGKNYYCSLFAAVEAVGEPDVELVFFTGCKTETEIPKLFPRLEVVRTPLMDRMHPWWIARQLGRLPSRRTLDPVFLWFLRHHRIEVLSHAFGFGDRAPIRSLVWFADFQFMRFPERWSAQQIRNETRLFKAAARNSDAVLLSSHAAQKDLFEFFLDFDKPTHVLHFVSSPVRIDGLRSADDLRRQYDLPPDYIYLPNQFWAVKNHGLVIEALRLLKQEGRSVTVVCTGKTADGRMPGYFESLMERVRDADVSDRFRVLGIVPHADVQSLMHHAHAVLNPSKSEGWSSSVEEARTLCKPLVLSDIAVHREQADELALFFDPDDAAQLAACLVRTLQLRPPTPAAADIEIRHRKSLIQFGRDYLAIIRSLLR